MPAASLDATPSAFRKLYEQRYAFVWGVLRRLGVPERDVEDLLQDVFVIVHRRLGEFEGRAAATTWLYAITVRVYWNYARRQQRRPPLATESANAMPILDDSVGPERFTEHREASALLEELLGSLDPDKRTAYVLAEIEGLSAPEIAEVTGAKTRTIYSRIRAAKQQVEASAKRVVARERNDVAVRELAQASTSRPPSGLQRRAWAALLVRVPELGSVSVATSWLTAKVAAAVLGVGAIGAVAVSQASSSDPVEPSAASVEPIALASTALPEPSPANPPVAILAPPAEPEAAVGEPVVPVAAPTPKKAPKPNKTAKPEPGDDLALLRKARVALKGDRPREALRLLDRHGAKHPRSPLARERERTRLLALCALGRTQEADVLAEAQDLPRACQ